MLCEMGADAVHGGRKREVKMMTIEEMKLLSERLYAEALRYNTISQVYRDLMDACAIIDHYVRETESETEGKES